ncbi:MAG: threonine-phosphate decarboxylase [Sphingobium sp.]
MNAWTFHGGRLADAQAAYGGAGDWIDLSTGINPHGWPHADAMRIDWRRLPDERDLAMLERAAASCFGVAPAQLCAVPGTEIGLRAITGLLPGPACHLAPSYRTHAVMLGGARPVAPEEVDGIGGGTLILANPNNPDGRLTDCAALLARRWDAGGWLVIDEAFADPRPETSMAGQVGDDVPLVLFRSFGKFFGLAGVRLGFVIGPAPLIAGVRDRLGAWPVSAAAIAIGIAAYRDGAWIAAMRATLERESAALDAVLRAHGFAPRGACPLFRLIETDDAAALFDRLARRAILTRPFDHDRRWLRIGLPAGPAALDRLDGALGHRMPGHG